MPSAGAIVDDERLRFVLTARPDLVEPLRAALRPELGDEPGRPPGGARARRARIATRRCCSWSSAATTPTGTSASGSATRARCASRSYSWQYPSLPRRRASPTRSLARGPIWRDPATGRRAERRLTAGPLREQETRDGRNRLRRPGSTRSCATGSRAPASRARIASRPPGVQLLTIPGSTPHDVARAAAAAAAAQPAWAETSYQERARILRRAAEIYEAHRDEFGTWTQRETGAVHSKMHHEQDFTVPGGPQRGDHAVAAVRLARCRPAQQGRLSMVRRVPVGVVGAITPVELADRARHAGRRAGPRARQRRRPQAGPADAGVSAARCSPPCSRRPACPTACSRSSSAAPTSARRSSPIPTSTLVSFTGSTAAGRRVGAAGRAACSRRSRLELGGNNAFVVLDDADLEAAASAGRVRLASSSRARSASPRAGTSSTAASPATTSTPSPRRRSASGSGDPYREDVELGPDRQREAARPRRRHRPAVGRGRRAARRGRHPRGPVLPTDGPGRRRRPTCPPGPTRSSGRSRRWSPSTPTTRRSPSPTRPSTGWPRPSTRARSRAASRSRNRIRAGMVHVNDQTDERRGDHPVRRDGRVGQRQPVRRGGQLRRRSPSGSG